MKTVFSKFMFYIATFCAATVMAFSTGCVSGGFKLTRDYARWVNSQNIFLRIILYILTSVVFAVTLIVDVVIFNTMDFWQGKVSKGDYHFSEEGRHFHVQHEFIEGVRRQSRIAISDETKILQTLRITETANGEVELYVDEVLRTRVRDIHALPVASIFDAQGRLVKEDFSVLSRGLMAVR